MLLIASGVFFALVSWLEYYTRHGQSVTIPNIKGKSLQEAIALLQDANLRWEVVDSLYEKNALAGSIMETYPSVGETVKPDRIIFLKVYATSAPKLAIPYVKDMSARQAYALLVALGFEQISQKVVAGEYLDLCQGIANLEDEPLEAGTLVNKETPLVLLVTGTLQLDSIKLEDLLTTDQKDNSIDSLTQSQSQGDEPQDEPENWW